MIKAKNFTLTHIGETIKKYPHPHFFSTFKIKAKICLGTSNKWPNPINPAPALKVLW